MANVPICALRPAAGAARGNVCLLAVDSISDLHSVPPDTETLQEEDGHRAKSLSADPPAPRRCAAPCTDALLLLLIVISLVNMSLILYVLHSYGHQDSLLRALTERLDSDSVHREFRRQESQ